MKIPTLIFVGLLASGLPSYAQATVPSVKPGNLRVPKDIVVTPSSPKLDVKNTTTGGPVSTDLMTNLQKLSDKVEALETQNADLKKQIASIQTQLDRTSKDTAQNSKDMVPVKLLIPAMDKAIGKVKDDLSSFKTEYDAHSHKTNFSYESFKFLTETPNNNKGNFYIPYIWLNSKPNLSQIEKQQSVQPYLNKTTNPAGK
ncbi:hypothetical protein EON83_14575 [bacterium]|nr:MAG: hypothetical protein EON83_14575 [bacterium]